MWIPSPTTLEQAPPASVFVLCRWTEFFDHQTPDSYRPRLCHLPRLVEEIAEVAGEAVEHSHLRKHFRQLKQECVLKLREETGALKICNSADLALLQSFTREAALPEDAARDAQALIDSGFAQRYQDVALARGKEEILKALAPPFPTTRFPSGCERANQWLNLWASIALNRSYEIGFDFVSREEAPLLLPVGELLDRIVTGINRPKIRYLCYVALRAQPLSSEQASRHGEGSPSLARLKSVLNAGAIELVSHLDLKAADAPPAPDELVAFKAVEARSPRGALEAFVIELQPILNILGFYQNYPPTEPIRLGWAGLATADLESFDLSQQRALLKPRKETEALSREAVRVYRSGRLGGSIADALEQYHIAVSSRDWRVKFTIMWSALESLSAGGEEEAVITRVTNMLVPIVTWRRLDKEIRYLGLALWQHREVTESRSRTSTSLPDASAREVPPENILMTVARPKSHPHINELLASVRDHCLLSWRVYSVWGVFHDPARLVSEYEASKERLTWHIGRIYRVRNALSHKGREPAQTRLLLDNLHFYLSTAISRVLTALKENPGFGPNEAVEYWQQHAARVLDQLATKPESVAVADVLSKCRIHRHACPWLPEVLSDKTVTTS